MLAAKLMPLVMWAMASVALLADSEVVDSKTAGWALIAGFTGMLGLQAWIIRYLLTEFSKRIDNLTNAVHYGRTIATERRVDPGSSTGST